MLCCFHDAATKTRWICLRSGPPTRSGVHQGHSSDAFVAGLVGSLKTKLVCKPRVETFAKPLRQHRAYGGLLLPVAECISNISEVTWNYTSTPVDILIELLGRANGRHFRQLRRLKLAEKILGWCLRVAVTSGVSVEEEYDRTKETRVHTRLQTPTQTNPKVAPHHNTSAHLPHQDAAPIAQTR